MQRPGRPTPGQPSAIRPPIASNNGAGILTCFPSATHFCLALGADSPYADERCVGNLGLTARGPFTPFIATHVSIRTSDTSSNAYASPSQAYRTLSYHASVPFNPLQFSASLNRAIARGLARFSAQSSRLLQVRTTDGATDLQLRRRASYPDIG